MKGKLRMFSNDQQGRAKRDLFLLFAPLTTLGAVVIFFFSGYHWSFRILSVCTIVALTSSACGGLLGFLFGIPKTLQQSENPNGPSQNQNKSDYLSNTNLEQISDWLTKIIVGVGLTQLTSIPKLLDTVGGHLSKALNNDSSSKVLSIGLVIFFCIVGFMFAFLATRLFLKNAFISADSVEILEEINKLKDQSGIDASAISLVNKKLQNSGGIEDREIDLKQLADFIMNASPAAKVSIFYSAQKVRSDNWQDNKELMERTIPIFDALCKSDTENRFHQNYGQLGYALKDKSNPEYANAERVLTRAINIRGDGTEYGWVLYEFNRAVCRIMMDEKFIEGKPTDEGPKARIFDDLSLASTDPFVKNILEKDIVVRKWLDLNSLTNRFK